MDCHSWSDGCYYARGSFSHLCPNIWRDIGSFCATSKPCPVWHSPLGRTVFHTWISCWTWGIYQGAIFIACLKLVRILCHCSCITISFQIYVLQTFCFSVSGENLTLRLRYQAFKAMMRQEMGWFDEEEHSTGALTSTLADDTRNVQGVSFPFGTHHTKHSYKNRI